MHNRKKGIVFNMGFKRNEKYEQIALYTVISLAVIVIIYFAIQRFDLIRSAFGFILEVLSPFIYGFIFAYLANPIMGFFEDKVFRFSEKRVRLGKCRRAFSVVCTLLVVALALTLLALILIPQITESYTELESQIGGYVKSAQEWADGFIKDFPLFNGKYQNLSEFLDVNEVTEKIKELITNSYSFLSGAAANIVSYTGAVVIEVKNILLGVILAVYFLLAKDKLCAMAKKILASRLKKKRYINLLSLVRYTDRSFGQFIRGKLLDSLIIGILTFTVLAIFGFPFYPLIALLVGVTNMIPVFGPIIGAIPAAFIVFIVDPGRVIWLVIIIVIIQQLDGNVIGPFILGDAVGLSAMWIVISITLGGALFGIMGMFLAVPAMSVIYALVRETVSARLAKRGMETDTMAYLDYPPKDEMPKGAIFLQNEGLFADDTDAPDEKDAPADTDAPADADESDDPDGGK